MFFYSSVIFRSDTSFCNNLKPNHFAQITMLVNGVTPYIEGPSPHIIFC